MVLLLQNEHIGCKKVEPFRHILRREIPPKGGTPRVPFRGSVATQEKGNKRLYFSSKNCYASGARDARDPKGASLATRETEPEMPEIRVSRGYLWHLWLRREIRG